VAEQPVLAVGSGTRQQQRLAALGRLTPSNDQ
jgi:hypothetical protein